MTELEKAASKALEALESKWLLGSSMWQEQQRHAITALRRALEQPAQQEPVAWLYDWYAEDEDLEGNPTGGIVNDWISKDYDEAHSPTNGCHNIRPLYTSPQARDPLTDEQKAILKECRNQAMKWALQARVPECAGFAGIAQDLDWLCNQLAIEIGEKKKK